MGLEGGLLQHTIFKDYLLKEHPRKSQINSNVHYCNEGKFFSDYYDGDYTNHEIS